MIVDTSALVALLLGEPGWTEYRDALRADPAPKISAGSYLECSIVMERQRGRDPRLAHEVDALLKAFGMEVVTFTPSQAQLARRAYREFGKGSGHRAGLNFGDCFVYALAVETDEPLLCKGDDFVHTGVRSALPN